MEKDRRLSVRLREGIAAWLYPRGACCLCCRHPRRASREDCLCENCRGEIKALRVPAGACNRCLSPVKKGAPCAFCSSRAMDAIENVYAPYRYAGSVRQLILQLKFNHCGEALPLLALPMAEAAGVRAYDAVVPVPLHPRRMRQRGFNQAALMGEMIGKRLNVPVMNALSRKTYRRPQSRTPMKKRAKNVFGSFACVENVQGMRVLLVDDVRTSGSTAAACAEELMAAGAQSVCLCVAAVVYRKPGPGR